MFSWSILIYFCRFGRDAARDKKILADGIVTIEFQQGRRNGSRQVIAVDPQTNQRVMNIFMLGNVSIEQSKWDVMLKVYHSSGKNGGGGRQVVYTLSVCILTFFYEF